MNSSYEIGKNEYRELKYFCLQYNDFVKTERHTDVITIEHALRLTTDSEILRGYLRRAVTTETPFENLDVPMGRRQFYALRRKFFYILRDLRYTEIFSERKCSK